MNRGIFDAYDGELKAMAGSTFHTNPFDLFKLLNDCHHGVLQLPDFQRSWVWGEDAPIDVVGDLINHFVFN